MPTLPLVLPGDLSGGGILLRQYRMALADQIGFLIETSVSVAAAHGEARRVVLADEFRDDDAATMDLLPGGGIYLYVRSGDQTGSQRRALLGSEAGYDGPRGMVTLSRPFDAPLAAGTVIDATSPLPVKRHLGIKGLDDCINEALARLPLVVRLTLTGDGTDQHSLSAHPWLTHDDQILGLYDSWTVTTGNALAPSPYGARIDTNGVARVLVTERAYTTGETAEVAAVVPADRLIYDGAQWTYATTPGLHDENDRAAVPEHWVTAFAAVKALQFLERLTMQRRDVSRDERLDMVTEIRSRRATWTQAAKRIMLTEFPRPTQKRTPALLSGSLATENGWTESGLSSWP